MRISDVREKYFDENGFYAENDEYRLIEPQEAYKEEYFNLCRESYVFKEKLDDEEYRKLSWKLLFRMGLILFVIEKSSDRLCGYVELKYVDSDMPEIGIELLSEYQRKGIGNQMIRLMLQKAQTVHSVDCYQVRIYADNINSQKLFERMGAMRIGEDDCDGVKMHKVARTSLSEEMLKSFNAAFEELYKDGVPEVYLYELKADKLN